MLEYRAHLAYEGEIERKASERMSLRSSFWVPITFALLFSAFDMYHVYTQMDFNEKTAMEIASLYGFELLRVTSSYFPSTLLPFAVFVVLQQSIYNVPAGVTSWKLGKLMLLAVAYAGLYFVYIAQGGTEPLLASVMAVATVAFGFNIWFSLDKEIRRAPAEWRRIMGKR